MPTCKEIMEAFPGRFQAAAAPGWETVIQFNCSGDGGGSWYLTVKGGAATVSEGTADGAKATVTTDAATWVGINTGKMDPMMAFTTGKLKVGGAVGEVIKLNNPSVFKRGGS